MTEPIEDSVYSNYGDYFEAWNDGIEEECPECRGTCMDRDELYDCKLCFGEGVLVFFELPDENSQVP